MISSAMAKIADMSPDDSDLLRPALQRMYDAMIYCVGTAAAAREATERKKALHCCVALIAGDLSLLDIAVLH